MKQIEVTLTVNKKEQTSNRRAAGCCSDFLRHDLHLHGTHVAPDAASAALVLLSLTVRPSFLLMFAAQADGSRSPRWNGSDRSISCIRCSRRSKKAKLQSGFCRRMLMVAIELLSKNPNPTEDEICERFQEIFAAAPATEHCEIDESAAKKMRVVTGGSA